MNRKTPSDNWKSLMTLMTLDTRDTLNFNKRNRRNIREPQEKCCNFAPRNKSRKLAMARNGNRKN